MSSSLNTFTEGLNNALKPSIKELKYDHFTKRVIEAQMGYCENTPERIQGLLNKPQDPSVLHKYSSMSYIEMWENAADEMSLMMHAIYKVCRNLPGFGDYYKSKEHKRVMPACLYDLIIIGMAPRINLQKDEILYGEVVLPMSLVARNPGCHPGDLELVVATLEAAKKIAGFQLTDLENTLYQILVLSYPEREGLGDLDLLPQLHAVVLETLEMAIQKFHPDEAKELLDKLINLIPKLGDLGVMHMQALRRFEEAHPDHRFPYSVYQELFCNNDIYKKRTKLIRVGSRTIEVECPSLMWS